MCILKQLCALGAAQNIDFGDIITAICICIAWALACVVIQLPFNFVFLQSY